MGWTHRVVEPAEPNTLKPAPGLEKAGVIFAAAAAMCSSLARCLALHCRCTLLALLQLH